MEGINNIQGLNRREQALAERNVNDARRIVCTNEVIYKALLINGMHIDRIIVLLKDMDGV